MKEDFQEFQKIPRLFREIIITEKIDGTNAQVYITDEGEMFYGSRTRYIQPGNDNFGFASWCEKNRDELMKLGPGHHYGEWWGVGIQRGYNTHQRTFSLFNVSRWADSTERPACCSVVPVLYQGPYSNAEITSAIEDLRQNGSKASPGYMKPEGIIIYHTALRGMFKVTMENDEGGKGK